MKYFLSLFKLLTALALLPFALELRSSLLLPVRHPALIGLICLSIALIFLEIRSLKKSGAREWGIRSLGSLALLVAITVLTVTVGQELRFRCVRHYVLHADTTRLERMGRHLVVGYRSPAALSELIRLRSIAGVFLSSHNVRGKTVPQIKAQVQSWQSMRKRQGLPPLLIATDQEGGVVSRLSPPLPHMPGLSEIVANHSDSRDFEDVIRKFGEKQGRELAEIGVNLNFAPVVDLNHDVRNPYDQFTRIFERAVSSDPKVVTQVARWYCEALEQAGVRCTLKHFPGLGRVFEDTHLRAASLDTPLSELSHSDWAPFRELMNTGAFTMLGHVRLTAVDAKLPVSISHAIIAGMLRNDWKHDGVLITDDFSMRAVHSSAAGAESGSVMALNAGVDLILVSWDSDQYYYVMYALLKADEQGKLDKEMLRRSDERLKRAIAGNAGFGKSVTASGD
jgi:beta-N-acetylhexosaminidase